MITQNVNYKLINQNFPHVGSKIEALWGTPECDRYLNSLMINDRPTPRLGFPQEVGSAIYKLIALHDSLFSDTSKTESIEWEGYPDYWDWDQSGK